MVCDPLFENRRTKKAIMPIPGTKSQRKVLGEYPASRRRRTVIAIHGNNAIQPNIEIKVCDKSEAVSVLIEKQPIRTIPDKITITQ